MKNITLKPALLSLMTMRQHWLGKTKPKQAFRLTQNTFNKFVATNLKTELSTDWLIN